jgi:hypothetical protein
VGDWRVSEGVLVISKAGSDRGGEAHPITLMTKVKMMKKERVFACMISRSTPYGYRQFELRDFLA